MTDLLTVASRMRPMLAVPGALPGSDAGWAYEMKWDGVRAVAAVSDGTVRLWSRSGRDITISYPELEGLATAVRAAGPVVLDGEVVAFAGQARPSFAALQQRMHVASAVRARQLAAEMPVCYLVFDVLVAGGRQLLDEPYQQRRALLEALDLQGGSWQTPPSFSGEAGARVQAVSLEHRLEGIVAKRLGSRYEPGTRSASWRKIKNIRRQEFVIGGWQPGEGGRAGRIGSLLVGVHGPGGLQYAGHVGTGFTDQALRLLGELLRPLGIPAPPFAMPMPAGHGRGAVWVQPRLVAEVAYAEWNPPGLLRAPSYQGLRADKDPAEVIKEPGS